MNTLGLMLLGSIAHATAFGVVGIVAYLALRRWGPAAGSLAAGSSLLIMAVVSMIVLGPWPRWWTVAPDAFVPAESSLRSVGDSTSSPSPRADTTAALGPMSSGSPNSRSPASSAEPLARPAFLTILLEELRRPGRSPETAHWGWPEWLAAGFFASLFVGLARLGLGLWGIARIRARSLMIDDRELQDEVEIVRAELSCTRRVEVREMARLATPATIGWRRPLLLLPGDWRDWGPDERRAVLAHELAHVRRGDFLAGLAAQLGLSLHFYHPLAHWLAARLRLEQELAADAWAARLSGGKPSYLATLARMALRRDSRAMSWPARAFLPSHDTFVRRIEMLRNTQQIRPGSLPLVARILTVGGLAALGLLVAGLRGPAGWPAAAAEAQAAPQPQAGLAKATGTGSDQAPFNLAFLPGDTKMLLAVRPGSLLRRRDIQSLVNSMRQERMLGPAFVVPPEDIEQLLVFWEGDPQAHPGPSPPFSGVVLRMAKPQDWNGMLKQFINPNQQEARHDGQSYVRVEPNGPPSSWGFYLPDDRTLVAAPESLLRDLIEDRNAAPPRQSWDEAWKKIAKGQLNLAVDTRWLRRRIGPGPAGPGYPPQARFILETLSPLLEKARSYAVGIDASDRQITMDLQARAGSEEDAKPVADTLQAFVTLGKNAAQGMRQEFGRKPGGGEAMEWILRAVDSLLDKARIDTSEGFVHLRAETSVDLAEGIQLLVPAVTAARAANRRAVSMNNLKQIGLALHNYNAANNAFPAQVLYGGKTGKVPYSWRVAILPYIEQQELYKAYNFDEPWDGPNNRKLLDKMPAIYSHPDGNGTPSSQSKTSYFTFAGPTTALYSGPRPEREADRIEPQVQQFTDGTSNTIMVVEAQRDIPWTKPEDIPFDPNVPLPELGGFTPDGFNALFADGSVRYITKSIAPQVLKALITRAGGEVISSDSY